MVLQIKRTKKENLPISIIFCGPVSLYNYFQTFDVIEKYFNCKIKKINSNKFFCKINNTKINFYFCLNPTRDKNYTLLKQRKKTGHLKESIPLPADELVKQISESKVVLSFGLCGAFKGKKSEIYLPVKFKKLLFNENYINSKEIKKIENSPKIKINNFLVNKITGRKSTDITSNLLFVPEDEKDNGFFRIVKFLSKFGDVIEKENYPIVKFLKDKTQLGIMLFASDTLNRKSGTLKFGYDFKQNKNKFNYYCIKSIKTALQYNGFAI